MKIFLLGYSGVSKTPLAELVAKALEHKAKHIKASAWIRNQFPNETDVEKLSQIAAEQLHQKPNVCIGQIEYELRAWGSYHEHFIIDGIRNPRDFVHLFDYKQDLAIHLQRRGIYPQSTFEYEGLKVISQYLNWLNENKIAFNSTLNLFFKQKNNHSKDNHFVNNIITADTIVEDLEQAVPVIVKAIQEKLQS